MNRAATDMSGVAPTVALKRTIKRSPVWPLMRPLIRPRKLHLFEIGAPKTGTLSIAALFAGSYRSLHEPRVDELAKWAVTRKSGTANESQLRKELRRRDRELWLDCEASHMLVHVVDLLVQEFPKAKFVLTVREPHAWLRSNIDQCLNHPREKLPPYYRALRDVNFGTPPVRYPDEEEVLAKHGLHGIDGFLSYWRWHNSIVIESVPSDRLLIIRTSQLSDELDRIADFAGVPKGQLAAEKRHSHASPKRHNLLAQISSQYIGKKVEAYCSDMAWLLG